MPHSAQSPTGPEPKSSERIPPLTNVAPSIFVPLRDDILSVELPRDRVERLKQILKSIDYQREGVKENLLYMFEREKRRMVLCAAETEQAAGVPKIRPGLPPDEVDSAIRNMEAPAEPGVDYRWHIPSATKPAIPPIAPDASLRDRTVLELLTMIEAALENLAQYEVHMAGIKKKYLDCLEREMTVIEEAGKRPEERSGGRVFF